MRVRLVVVALLATALVLPAQTAGADGGAFIEFRGGSGSGTHFLPGDSGSGTAFVSIPERWQDLVDRGPFYVYLVPGNRWIQEGRPLPEGVIRLGTATIEHDSRTIFRVTTNFTVPDVPGDYYTIQFCNEPCTVSGFRESLSGQISIVQTLREATLLNEQQRLYGKNWNLRRQVRKADRQAEELQASFDALEADRNALLEETADLEDALARATRSAPAAGGRPLVEPWALLALGIAVIVALTAIAMALVFARRRAPDEGLVVPDTIAELDDEREDALTRT
jgi:hypothetical protein